MIVLFFGRAEERERRKAQRVGEKIEARALWGRLVHLCGRGNFARRRIRLYFFSFAGVGGLPGGLSSLLLLLLSFLIVFVWDYWTALPLWQIERGAAACCCTQKKKKSLGY